MPDLNDAKHQLAEALTEAGALPQWEPVTWRSDTNEPDTWRLRIPGGWLYNHGASIVFVPYMASDDAVQAAETNADEWFARAVAAGAERDDARKQLHRLEEENGRLLGRVQSLQDALAAARAAADEWAAIARDVAGKPPARTAEPCARRAPANVGPSSFVMRGCTLPEGHHGPCETRR